MYPDEWQATRHRWIGYMIPVAVAFMLMGFFSGNTLILIWAVAILLVGWFLR